MQRIYGCLLLLIVSGGVARAYTAGDYDMAALLLYRQGQYGQAVRYYQAAVGMDPNDWQAYQGLGNCEYAEGEKDQALTDYRKSLDLHPDNPSLKSFVDKWGGAGGTAAENGGSPFSRRAGKLEVLAGGGVAFDVNGTDVGPGGFLGCLYYLDAHWAVGAVLGGYFFNSTTHGWDQLYDPTLPGYVDRTTDYQADLSRIEAMVEIKSCLGGKALEPYFTGGIGLLTTPFNEKIMVSYDPSNDPNYPPSTSSVSATGSVLMLQAGFGMEAAVAPACVAFVEAKWTVYADSNSAGGLAGGYVPLVAGVGFGL